jgi:hypothetical protein
MPQESTGKRVVGRSLSDQEIKRREASTRFKVRNPWIQPFYDARNRCNKVKLWSYKYYGGRGIKFNLSKEEIKEIWERDCASNMDCPTIDRIDNDKDYVFSNVQFIEKRINARKQRKVKCVGMYKDGVFIKSFCPISQVEFLGFNRHAVSQCCNETGGYKKHHGYEWKFIERKDHV